MQWLLFVLIIEGLPHGLPPNLLLEGVYDTMEECFERRQGVVRAIGEPIVNYQAICVALEPQGDEV
jgi:hypothetical protein